MLAGVASLEAAFLGLHVTASHCPLEVISLCLGGLLVCAWVLDFLSCDIAHIDSGPSL